MAGREWSGKGRWVVAGVEWSLEGAACLLLPGDERREFFWVGPVCNQGSTVDVAVSSHQSMRSKPG